MQYKEPLESFDKSRAYSRLQASSCRDVVVKYRKRRKAILKNVHIYLFFSFTHMPYKQGGGPRVVISTAAFHAIVWGSVPGLGGLKETKMFLPYPRVKLSIIGSIRDREVACLASDRQGWNFESCVWRTVSSHSSHHPQEVLLVQFSLYYTKVD